MTALVENDARVADALRATVPGTITRIATSADLESHLAGNPDEHAVVLGPSLRIEEAVAIAERNRVLRPALGMVLLRDVVDADVLAHALRSGMREVVAVDDVGAIGQAVRRAQVVARAMLTQASDDGEARSVPGGVVTVFSTKGGVGKSLVATNLAVALADLQHRVCIVDLDVQGGDVAIMLSLTPQHTLADLGRINGELDADAVQSLLTQHSERLFVLAAPIHLGSTVPPASVGAVLKVLTGMFDVVVVDTSGSFDDHALQALDNSDLLVLVGTLDIPSLKSLKLAVGTLDLLNFPREHWRLVINRADSRIGLSPQEMSQTLGLEVTATVPTSRDILMAVNRGEPIVRADRNHEVSKMLMSVAARFATDIALPTRGDSASGSRRRGGRRGLRAKKVA